MEKYSHEAFTVTGLKISTSKLNNVDQKEIKETWYKFMKEKIGDTIEGKLFPQFHAVYYNYKDQDNLKERSFDVILGFITDPTIKQKNPILSTLNIPAQDYMYETKVLDPKNMQKEIFELWEKINNLDNQILPRIYGYDLEMYSEDKLTLTIAIAIK